MALRVIPIRQSGNRPNLFMGGDRELVMFSILIAATSIFAAMEIKRHFGIALWIFALFALRLMAKFDPMLRHILRRFTTNGTIRRAARRFTTTCHAWSGNSTITAITILIVVLGARLLPMLFMRIRETTKAFKR